MSSTLSSSSSVRSMADAMIVSSAAVSARSRGRSACSCWLVSYMPLVEQLTIEGQSLATSDDPHFHFQLFLYLFTFVAAVGLGLLFVKQKGVADAADNAADLPLTYQDGARVELVGLRKKLRLMARRVMWSRSSTRARVVSPSNSSRGARLRSSQKT